MPFPVTLNDPIASFKVTPLFNADYLRNCARCRHNYSDLIIGTYALFKRVISHDLELSYVT